MLTGEVPFKADNLVGVAMKHVNEKIPDVQKRRRDVSAALAAVVERATEKKPDKRYSDMNAMLADLENALEVEVARGGRSTGEATTVLDIPRRQRLVPSRRVSIAGILLVLAATAAALVIAALSGGGDKQRENTRRGGTPPGRLRGRTHRGPDFDPEGGDGEHPDEVKLAIDGIPNTTWQTETYTAGPDLSLSGKDGVGLIVEAAEPVEGQSSPSAPREGGWSADIYAAAAARRPTRRLGRADRRRTQRRPPAHRAHPNGPAKDYLIWFTNLADADDGGRVEVSDVALNGA